MSRSKKKNKRILYTVPIIIILGFFAYLTTNAAFNAWQKMSDSSEKRKIAEKELEELTDRYNFIENRLEYLNTDKGVEEAIRTKFNVAKENEKVFIIVDESSDAENTVEQKGIWDNIKYFFKNLF